MSKIPIIGKTNKKSINLFIGMPIGRSVETFPLESWARLLAYTAANPRYILTHMYSRSSYIDQNRDRIAARALKDKADYVLMIDSDMVYSPDLVDRLIKHNKDVVGVVYKNPSWNEKLGRVDKLKPMLFDYNSKKQQFYAWEECKQKKLFRVDAVGTGIMLIKTDVFKKFPRPWFPFIEHRQLILGEDLGFCLNCMAHNIEVWVDPTMRIGHEKPKVYWSDEE